jgi:hypothetical protein
MSSVWGLSTGGPQHWQVRRQRPSKWAQWGMRWPGGPVACGPPRPLPNAANSKQNWDLSLTKCLAPFTGARSGVCEVVCVCKSCLSWFKENTHRVRRRHFLFQAGLKWGSKGVSKHFLQVPLWQSPPSWEEHKPGGPNYPACWVLLSC